MKKYGKRLAAAVFAAAVAFAPAHRVCGGENGTDGAGDTGELTLEEQLQASYDVIPDTNEIEGWPQGRRSTGTRPLSWI